MGPLIKLARLLAQIVNGLVLCIAAMLFAWMGAVLFFLLTGRLQPGPMWYDMNTPSYAGAVTVLLTSGAVVAACVAVHRWLRRSAAPAH